jgi:hypothetical protein
MLKVSLTYVTAVLVVVTAAAASAAPSAHDVVTAWRQAVHAPGREADRLDRSVEYAKFSTTENGMRGTREEWVSANGSYRRSTVREFDADEMLITAQGAQTRDWNGYVRMIDDTELERYRSEAQTAGVLSAGPPVTYEELKFGESEDHKFWTLADTPFGGTTTVWFLDRQSGLPDHSVSEGITTSYADWRPSSDGVLIPRKRTISVPDKPVSEYALAKPMTLMSADPAIFARLRPGPSDVAMQGDVVTLPFTMEANHIFLQVQVNGHAPIGFLLDTGDDKETLNTTRLAEFGLTSYGASTLTGGGGPAGSAYVRDATFTMAGVELRHQHATVLDLTGLERAYGIKVGGLLGYDFISRFVLDIDYEAKVMKLTRPSAWHYSGSGTAVPITFDDGIPFAEAYLSVPTKPQIPAHMIVDFGAADTMILTSPFVKANDLVRLAATDTTARGMPGLEHQFFTQNNMRGRIDELRLGTLSVRGIPCALSANTSGAYADPTFAGTIGEGIYTRYHMIIDYAHRHLVFEETAKSNAPFEERKSFGLTLIATGDDLHTFNVAAVRPGSPAEAAGFKKDDVIAGLDSKPASDFTLHELRDWLAQDGTRHVFRVSRAGQELSIDTTITFVSLDRKP